MNRKKRNNQKKYIGNKIEYTLCRSTNDQWIYMKRWPGSGNADKKHHFKQFQTHQIRKKKINLKSDNIKCWGGSEAAKTHTAGSWLSNHKIYNYHEPIQWLKLWKCLVSIKQLIMTNQAFWEHMRITAKYKFWPLMNRIQSDSAI